MKISVIMQVYLGPYPGARSNPQYKFIRAVNSFLLQKHQDKELIIVADGCDESKLLYEHCFHAFPEIKFAYVARGDLPRMYDVRDNKKWFRGIPRQVGRTIASGDLITYMDADDIMLPSRLSQLNLAWEGADSSKLWSYNTMVVQPKSDGFRLASENQIDLKLFGFPVEQKVYAGYMVPAGYMIASPPALTHRPSVKSTWKDTFDLLDDNGKKISGGSEDAAFVDGLQAESQGYKNDSPTYVVCHYKGDASGKNAWDI
jgi:glycosyltransferase involved in cell wall biosynthesis